MKRLLWDVCVSSMRMTYPQYHSHAVCRNVSIPLVWQILTMSAFGICSCHLMRAIFRDSAYETDQAFWRGDDKKSSLRKCRDINTTALYTAIFVAMEMPRLHYKRLFKHPNTTVPLLSLELTSSSTMVLDENTLPKSTTQSWTFPFTLRVVQFWQLEQCGASPQPSLDWSRDQISELLNNSCERRSQNEPVAHSHRRQITILV